MWTIQSGTTLSVAPLVEFNRFQTFIMFWVSGYIAFYLSISWRLAGIWCYVLAFRWPPTFQDPRFLLPQGTVGSWSNILWFKNPTTKYGTSIPHAVKCRNTLQMYLWLETQSIGSERQSGRSGGYEFEYDDLIPCKVARLFNVAISVDQQALLESTVSQTNQTNARHARWRPGGLDRLCSSKSTCSICTLSNDKWLSFDIQTLRDVDNVLWLDEIDDRAAFATFKSRGELDIARPSSPTMTGRGMIIVQWRLPTRGANIKKDDGRIFPPATSTAYLGMMIFVGFGVGFLVHSACWDGYRVVRNLSFTDRKILQRWWGCSRGKENWLSSQGKQMNLKYLYFLSVVLVIGIVLFRTSIELS